MRFLNLKSTPPKKGAKSAHRRPSVKPLWRRPPVIAAVGLLIVAGVSGAGFAVWQSGWIQRTAQDAKWRLIAGSAHLGFSVNEIFVEGRDETDRDSLRAALRLKRGAPILAFDPVSAKRRVEGLPWVRSVSIERQLPDVVHVRIVERRPLALWQRKGTFALIDTEGEIIPIKKLDRFNRLVVLVGDGAPKHATRLLDMLANEPSLALRVTAAVRVSGRRWNIHLDNRITVRLPEVSALDAWRQLAVLEKKHGLLERDLIGVDLRIPDRVVLRRSPNGESGAKKTEKDT
ncbi:MAG: FtsQ-type POTRA domain-containing protein [Proteobacteria bacterium]|nr:FtsQ-type POTRA domain-containing protein [Pseudomonadota bacterium]